MVEANNSMFLNNFSFFASFEKAVEGENNSFVLTAKASDNQPDLHYDRMSDDALEQMVKDAKVGLPLLPDHKSTFEIGRTINGYLKRHEDTLDFYIDIELLRDDPYANRLFNEVKSGKVDKQLSIGGWIEINEPEAVSWEVQEDNSVIRVINKIRLDHIALTRARKAANPRTGFIKEIFKELGKDFYYVSLGEGFDVLDDDEFSCNKEKYIAEFLKFFTKKAGFRRFGQLKDTKRRDIIKNCSSIFVLSSCDGDLNKSLLPCCVLKDDNIYISRTACKKNLEILENVRYLLDDRVYNDAKRCLQSYIDAASVKGGDVNKDCIDSDEYVVNKARVPFKSFPLAPKDTEWSFKPTEGDSVLLWGAGLNTIEEFRQADEMVQRKGWIAYKSSATYFDPTMDEEHPEVPFEKQAYALHHHKIIDNEMKTVLRGVIAAAASINGARGGFKRETDDEERRKLYRHLQLHAKEFNVKLPAMRPFASIGKDDDIYFNMFINILKSQDVKMDWLEKELIEEGILNKSSSGENSDNLVQVGADMEGKEMERQDFHSTVLKAFKNWCEDGVKKKNVSCKEPVRKFDSIEKQDQDSDSKLDVSKAMHREIRDDADAIGMLIRLESYLIMHQKDGKSISAKLQGAIEDFIDTYRMLIGGSQDPSSVDMAGDMGKRRVDDNVYQSLVNIIETLAQKQLDLDKKFEKFFASKSNSSDAGVVGGESEQAPAKVVEKDAALTQDILTKTLGNFCKKLEDINKRLNSLESQPLSSNACSGQEGDETANSVFGNLFPRELFSRK